MQQEKLKELAGLEMPRNGRSNWVFPQFIEGVWTLELEKLTGKVPRLQEFTPEGKKPYKRVALELTEIDEQGTHKEIMIPLTVYSTLKEFIKEYKVLKGIKVKRKGEGLETEYTVLPVL